jgi:alpha-ketoglutarate-dependent taurine dioxygenase
VLLAQWLRGNRDRIDGLLLRSGAILFRGFEPLTVPALSDVGRALMSRPMPYADRSSPRSEVAEDIYTSTEHPADQEIFFHCELSYSDTWPMRLVFYCSEPAERGGETPVADTRLVARRLSPSTLEAFSRRGIEYVRNLEPRVGLPWQEVFQTSDRDDVTRQCRQRGAECTWLGRDHLIVRWRRPAFRTHPQTGETVWFNHAAFFHSSNLPESVRTATHADEIPPFETRFGDGTAIPDDLVDEVGSAYREASIEFPWRHGDVLLLDNMLVAHSRRPFEGNRRILLTMGEPASGEVA